LVLSSVTLLKEKSICTRKIVDASKCPSLVPLDIIVNNDESSPQSTILVGHWPCYYFQHYHGEHDSNANSMETISVHSGGSIKLGSAVWYVCLQPQFIVEFSDFLVSRFFHANAISLAVYPPLDSSCGLHSVLSRYFSKQS
jgi:hypothetical protein